MVSRHDPFITKEAREHCSALAEKIRQLAGGLLDKHGQDVPNTRDARGDLDRDPGTFLRRYQDDEVLVEHQGPENLPSDWPFTLHLFLRRGRRRLMSCVGSTPPTLECDTAVAEEFLAKRKSR